MVESVEFVPDLLVKGLDGKVSSYSTFSTLIERANHWLRQNTTANVINCETLALKPRNGQARNAHFDPNWTGSSEYMGGTNDAIRSPELKALRLWYRNTNAGNAQKIGATLVVPRLTGVEDGTQRPEYETLQDTLSSVNRSLGHHAMPGSLLATETVRLFVNKGSKDIDPELTYKVFPGDREEEKIFDINCLRLWFREGAPQKVNIGYEDFVPVLSARRTPLSPVYEDYVGVWSRMEKWVYEKTDIMLTNIQSLIVEELNDEGSAAVATSHVSFQKQFRDPHVRIFRLWYLNDTTKLYRPPIRLHVTTLQSKLVNKQAMFEIRYENHHDLVDRIEETANKIFSLDQNWAFLNLQTNTIECTSAGNTNLREMKSQHLPFGRKFISAFFVIQEDGMECEEEWTARVQSEEEAAEEARVMASIPPPSQENSSILRTIKRYATNLLPGMKRAPAYRDFVPAMNDDEEFESFSSIVEEANVWLSANRQVKVVNVETRNLRPWGGRAGTKPTFNGEWTMSTDWVTVKAGTAVRHNRAPILKAIRVWYSMENEGPPFLLRQTLLQPVKEGEHPDHTPIYESFEETVDRFNENTPSWPIEGPILNCEVDRVFVGHHAWDLDAQKTYEPFSHRRLDVYCIRVWHLAGGYRYETIGYEDFPPMKWEDETFESVSATLRRASRWAATKEEIIITNAQVVSINAGKDEKLKLEEPVLSLEHNNPWSRIIRVWYKRPMALADEVQIKPMFINSTVFIPNKKKEDNEMAEIKYDTFEETMWRVHEWIRVQNGKQDQNLSLSLQTVMIPSNQEGEVDPEDPFAASHHHARACVTLFHGSFKEHTDEEVAEEGCTIL
ncbi:uncharacterized protein LOC135492701 [Lineus longissimus]|uniref:uncharacterized protein LOC135492701 n=1 Tax=Lineus longissimus TaxID=88925 RepID=UPI00315CF073